MSLVSLDRKRLSVITKYAVDAFTSSDWLAFGHVTGKLELVSNHPRLLRSLGFGDEDYEFHAAEVVNAAISDAETITAVIDHFDIELWYQQQEPKKYQKLFSGTVAKPADFWTPGYFRLFISHISKNKARMSALKSHLAIWGISGFVAHEDIEATREWRIEVESGLESMQLLVAVVEAGFKESDWCSQEVGWALGRQIDIIPLRAGVDPYGFFGKYQGIQIKGKTPEEVSIEIVKLLLRKPQHRDNVLSSFPKAFASLESAKKVSSFKLLDGWDIVDDSSLKTLVEQASLSDFEKKELKHLITRVKAFEALPTTPEASDEIPF